MKYDTFDSMKSAAAALRLPLSLIKKAKYDGCPAFRGSRVVGTELMDWLKEHQEKAEDEIVDVKDAIDRETHRKLLIANDQKEGRLIQRAWVAERVQRLAGELKTFMAKCEAEHPKLAAAAGDDIVKQRELERAKWSEIMAKFQALAAHFEEAT